MLNFLSCPLWYCNSTRHKHEAGLRFQDDQISAETQKNGNFSCDGGEESANREQYAS